jgi:aminoglycoside phosphotransferase (APT) family kinase protein
VNATPNLALCDRAVKRLDPHNSVLAARSLKDGSSGLVIALDVQRDGGRVQRLVLRRYREADLERSRGEARDEFRLLQALTHVRLPTPRPYSIDTAADIFPEPYIVMEYLDGAPELARPPRAEIVPRMAATLAELHNADRSNLDLSLLPRQNDAVAALLATQPVYEDETAEERAVAETLVAVWPLAARNAETLLHGDFWPGNVLWRDGQLVGVIDWEDAALGDPLADLANTRFELLWAYGADAMREFTRAYTSLRRDLDLTQLPYWDLYADLRLATRIPDWSAEPASQRSMRTAHRWFIRQAFAQLAAAREV